jgi:hypothetical protein
MNNERDRAEAAEKAAGLYGLQFKGSTMWHESGEKKRFDYWAERLEWGKARAAANDFVLRIEREKIAVEGKSS